MTATKQPKPEGKLPRINLIIILSPFAVAAFFIHSFSFIQNVIDIDKQFSSLFDFVNLLKIMHQALFYLSHI